MAYIIKMPKLGLEMEQGTVLEWYAGQGDEVAEGDMLVEVESEKSIGEVDAREDGAIRHIFIEEGESVPPGTPIGILAAPDADIADLKAEAEAELEGEAPDAVSGDSGADDSGADDEVVETATSAAGGTADSAAASAAATQAVEQKVSPRARQRADDLGVDLADVEGTGFDGAITEDDVEAAAESESAETAEPEARVSPRARKRAEELGVDLADVEGTGFDGAITEDDVEAAAEAESEPTESVDAGVQVAAEAQLDRYQRATAVADPAAAEALVETMEAVRAAFEERVTMTDVLVVVASAALTDEPLLNGTYTEATHQVQETQHVALLSDGDDGLRSGVVEDAARRSLTEIVEARHAIQENSAESDVAPTFTLANAADTDAQGRLVNAPAVAALRVDATGQRAVPTDDGVDLQPLVTASLTYDTRAVGENEASAFLDALFERATQASELVLGSYRGTE